MREQYMRSGEGTHNFMMIQDFYWFMIYYRFSAGFQCHRLCQFWRNVQVPSPNTSRQRSGWVSDADVSCYCFLKMCD